MKEKVYKVSDLAYMLFRELGRIIEPRRIRRYADEYIIGKRTDTNIRIFTYEEIELLVLVLALVDCQVDKALIKQLLLNSSDTASYKKIEKQVENQVRIIRSVIKGRRGIKRLLYK